MQKQIGSIFFVAGTTIGSGIVALPLAVAKLGLIPGFALMLGIWLLMYYTALVNLELNLQAGKGLPLGSLGKLFSGPLAAWVGSLSFIVLAYALLAVFLYGGASILQELLMQSKGWRYSLGSVISAATLATLILLSGPLQGLDYVNRLVFLAKCTVIFLVIFYIGKTLRFEHLPLFTANLWDFSIWRTVIPVVFTAFGFQVIFHSMTNYCDSDRIRLKRAFLWGSLIPAMVYILWTSSVLSIIFQANPHFYQALVSEKVEIGKLISEVSQASSGQTMRNLFWWVSSLAVVTSLIGVGLGLLDFWKVKLEEKITNPLGRHFLAVCISILPAYGLAIWVPNAFIRILGFAGMILVIIAILLPIYLLFKARISEYIFKELSYAPLLILAVAAGLGIMACEVVNLLT